MHVLALTSPFYRHLDKGFSYLWRKYVGLPFEIFETEQNDWTGSIYKKVQTIDDKAILIVLTDYWMRKPMDAKNLYYGLTMVEEGKADKIDLQGQVAYWGHQELDGGILLAVQDARYRQSTQAAIWTPRYLLKCLAHGGLPWQWESDKWSMKDGALIYGFKSPVFEYSNVYYKGKPDQYQIDRLDFEDADFMRMIGHLDEINWPKFDVKWKRG